MLKTVLQHTLPMMTILLALSLGGCFYQYPKPAPQTEVPDWFEDAKLGIFIHWGIYSVPGYAPVETAPLIGVNRDTVYRAVSFWLKHGRMPEDPYAEWYAFKLRDPASATAAYHRDNYGEDFDYYDFIDTFNEQNRRWRPRVWAQLFKRIGARYVVLTSKHHDGVTLWPSRQGKAPQPEHQRAVARDIVGELTQAVREQGLRMGLYYSGGVDWSQGAEWVVIEGDRAKNILSDEYTAYADGHWLELIERYQPDILWNDILYPAQGDVEKIRTAFYQRTPDGVVNNRWYPAAMPGHYDTPEYTAVTDLTDYKWEANRGLGYSFGYNRMDDDWTTLSSRELIHYFADTVSKNGNLLLNIGPQPDGTIPDIQLDRLNALGDWLAINGEAIYGSRPWQRFAGTTAAGDAIRFSRNGDTLYAIFLGRPAARTTVIEDLNIAAGSRLSMLGDGEALEWANRGNDLEVKLPGRLPGEYAFTLRIDSTPAE